MVMRALGRLALGRGEGLAHLAGHQLGDDRDLALEQFGGAVHQAARARRPACAPGIRNGLAACSRARFDLVGACGTANSAMTSSVAGLMAIKGMALVCQQNRRRRRGVTPISRQNSGRESAHDTSTSGEGARGDQGDRTHAPRPREGRLDERAQRDRTMDSESV